MPTAAQPTKPTAPQRTATAAAAAALAAHAFKGLRDPIEVFRAGTHIDSKGRVKTFTQADLDQMVANVTGAGVPAVLGHPKETDRAWAWGKLRRDGDALLAEFADIDPDFEAYVDAGAYRERSVAVYQDDAAGWKVQHIGWLGAVPPALALRPLDYTDTRNHAAAGPADALYSFSSSDAATGWALGDVARLLRGLRDWLISDKGLDLADKVLPDWTITNLADTGRRVAEEGLREDGAAVPMPMFNHGATMPQTINTNAPAGTSTAAPAATTLTEADLQRARDEAAAAATAAAQAQFAAQGQELAELRAARQAERIAVQINGWKAAGLLLPAEEPGAAEFMAALEGGQAGEFTFSRASQTEPVRQTPAAWFAAFVAGRQAVRLAGAVGTGGTGAMGADPAPAVDTQDYQAIVRAANEYVHKEAQAGRTVSVAQAVAHVTLPRG
jgi:hypothetical protein